MGLGQESQEQRKSSFVASRSGQTGVRAGAVPWVGVICSASRAP